MGLMSALTPLTRDQFFGALFASKAARDGGVIRRQVRDVERYVGRSAFIAEMRLLGGGECRAHRDQL